MIKSNTITLLITSGIFFLTCLGALIYFSDQVHQDLIINHQYVGYNSNITNYDILSKQNYYGFVIFQSLYSNNNCSFFAYSNNLELKVKGYLEFNYPLYTEQFVYYKNDNSCITNQPSNLQNDTVMTIIFLITSSIFFYILIGYSIELYKEYKN